MLRVTFYSYKGGVGRTLAMLNVAAILAMAGRRVVAVDMDLEAPGFGLSSLTGGAEGATRPGLSDFILQVLEGETPEQASITRFAYPAPVAELQERLTLVPAGTRSMELARRLTELYADPSGDLSRLFEFLVAEIAAKLSPDYLLFDSQTGLSDVAGVCTVELPEVLVAVSGLNEQNLAGMERALAELQRHPARGSEVATLVVLSPVPRAQDVGVPELRTISTQAVSEATGSALHAPRRDDPLFEAVYRAQVRLLGPVLRDLAEAKGRFPRLRPADLLHGLEYDPLVPLTEELRVLESSRLASQHRQLARSLTRAHPRDEVLAGGDSSLVPILLDEPPGPAARP